MNFELSDRLKALPPYLFAELDRLKAEKKKKGIDVIDMGIGDPDMPTPAIIIQAMQRAVENTSYHSYPTYNGMESFRTAVAKWFKNRFKVTLDPASEIMALLGSKEGIANFPLAFLNPGDTVIITSPLYPPAFSGPLFAGANHFTVPLRRENRFLPNLKSIPKEIAEKAKTFYINYPNNPTGAVATKKFFEEIVEFAKNYQIAIIHDAAYSEIYYDEKPLSILEIDGGKDVAIEFHSFSKTFNMTGWRLGFAVGNQQLIDGLRKIKTNVDSGTFQAVQAAGIAALENYEIITNSIRKIYAKRRDIFTKGLKKLGFDIASNEATFYVWVATPNGTPSKEYSLNLLNSCGIIATPGVGFGDPGEGYVRFALTKDLPRLNEVLDRLKKGRL